MTAKTKQMEVAVNELLKHGPRSNKEMRSTLGLPSQKENQTLDRTLQKLRKAGKLHLVNGRWALTTTQVCPSCGGKGWV